MGIVNSHPYFLTFSFRRSALTRVLMQIRTLFENSKEFRYSACASFWGTCKILNLFPFVSIGAPIFSIVFALRLFPWISQGNRKIFRKFRIWSLDIFIFSEWLTAIFPAIIGPHQLPFGRKFAEFEIYTGCMMTG